MSGGHGVHVHTLGGEQDSVLTLIGRDLGGPVDDDVEAGLVHGLAVGLVGGSAGSHDQLVEFFVGDAVLIVGTALRGAAHRVDLRLISRGLFRRGLGRGFLGCGFLGGGSLGGGSRSGLLTAGGQSEDHHNCEEHCEKSFHFISSCFFQYIRESRFEYVFLPVYYSDIAPLCQLKKAAPFADSSKKACPDLCQLTSFSLSFSRPGWGCGKQ